MKQLTKFRVAVLAMALGMGGLRAEYNEDYYLYWMVDESYAPASGWSFQGAQLVAVLNDNTEVRAKASGWFYAQAESETATEPDAVTRFAGGPLKADLRGVVSSGDSPTIAGFFVEFYNYNVETKAFEMIGYSGLSSLTYNVGEAQDLQNAIADFRDDRNPHVATTYYSPSGYNVPEPSGGLLLLVGGAMLVLRRRRRG